ncbi:hypothetical protein CBR_g45286 [Chara braunii]|uniref:Uncharacterized protein n=1 Tax=Chara braunii TaxID=69332 RepID=A0A388LY35_CHABU|nr:hypothetical protein CBR_g45286 [Chara braunii]|eukprot:GBG87227.1 hypothetical protein CBR_g45286 [Chara braunii]
MMQEQACARTDLQLLKTKLQKSEERRQLAERGMQDVKNENSMLKVAHQEDVKLLKKLETQKESAKMLCESITETIAFLETQLKQGEEAKKTLEARLEERMRRFEESKAFVEDLLEKKAAAEAEAQKQHEENDYLKKNVEELEGQVKDFAEKLVVAEERVEKLEGEKEAALREFAAAKEAIENSEHELNRLRENLASLQEEVKQQAEDLTVTRNKNLDLVEAKTRTETQKQNLETRLEISMRDFEELQERSKALSSRVSELETTNAMGANNVEKLQADLARVNLSLEEEKAARESALRQLKEAENKFQELLLSNHSLQKQLSISEAKSQELRRWNEEYQKVAADKDSTSKEQFENCRKLLDESLNDRRALEEGKRKLEEKLASQAGTISDLQKSREELMTQFSGFRQTSESEMREVQEQLREREERLAALVTEKESMQTELTDELVELRKEQEKLHESNTSKEEALQALTADLEKLNSENIKMKEELASVEELKASLAKQAEQRVEAKQEELSKRLRDLSMRNSQELAEMKKRFQAETDLRIQAEREKLENVVREHALLVNQREAEYAAGLNRAQAELQAAQAKAMTLESTKDQMHLLEQVRIDYEERLKRATVSVQEWEVRFQHAQSQWQEQLRTKDDECQRKLVQVQESLAQYEGFRKEQESIMENERRQFEQTLQHANTALQSTVAEMEGKEKRAAEEHKKALLDVQQALLDAQAQARNAELRAETAEACLKVAANIETSVGKTAAVGEPSQQKHNDDIVHDSVQPKLDPRKLQTQSPARSGHLSPGEIEGHKQQIQQARERGVVEKLPARGQIGEQSRQKVRVPPLPSSSSLTAAEGNVNATKSRMAPPGRKRETSCPVTEEKGANHFATSPLPIRGTDSARGGSRGIAGTGLHLGEDIGQKERKGHPEDMAQGNPNADNLPPINNTKKRQKANARKAANQQVEPLETSSPHVSPSVSRGFQRQVRKQEYEVTADGTKTITVRKRKKSTFTYEETPKPEKKRERNVRRKMTQAEEKRNTTFSSTPGPSQSKTPHIGDLFGCGSLDPYGANADDPYAF